MISLSMKASYVSASFIVKLWICGLCIALVGGCRDNSEQYAATQQNDIAPKSGEEDFRKADPVAYATAAEDIKALEELLKSGADPNVCSSTAFITPLGWAAIRGNQETFHLLLDHGAKVDLDAGAGTALFLAASYGRLDMVKELLNRGADVNARGPHQLTPLMMAAAGGHLKIVRELLAAGADPSLAGADPGMPSNQQTAIDFANEKKHSDVVETIKEYQSHISP